MFRNMIPFIGVLLLSFCLVGCKSEGEQLTADQVVVKAAASIADAKPQEIWGMLPSQYQQDIESVLATFAGKMEPEVWQKGVGVLRKVSTLLQEKKTFILSSKMLKELNRREADKLKKNWDLLAEAYQELVESDLTDLNQLKHFDTEKFLAGPVARLMEKVDQIRLSEQEDKAYRETLAQLKSVKASILGSKGNVTTVRIQLSPQRAFEQPFVQVGGKWLPEDFAREFPQAIANARSQLGKMSHEAMVKDKQKIIQLLSMVDQWIDGLIATKTEAAFNQELGKGVAMVLLGGAMAR